MIFFAGLDPESSGFNGLLDTGFRRYDDKGVNGTAVIFAIIFFILSVHVFHEYISLTVAIPLIHIRLDDFLTGTVILISWVFPRFIYFSKSSKTLKKVLRI